MPEWLSWSIRFVRWRTRMREDSEASGWIAEIEDLSRCAGSAVRLQSESRRGFDSPGDQGGHEASEATHPETRQDGQQ